MGNLDGIRLKIKRAWDEINGLKSDIRGYLRADPAPYKPVVKFDQKTNSVIASVHIHKFPDPMWGIRIGEIVHNLRSSLDHIVWELATRKRLSSKEKLLTQFPIFETIAGFNKRGIPKFLNGVDPKAIAIILSEQPLPEKDGGTGEGIKSPLWHLKELSDTDKHCTIHLTGTLISQFNFSFPPLKHEVVVREIKRKDLGPIEQDTMLARGFFSGPRGWPFENRNVDCKLGTDIAFDSGTPAVGGWLAAATVIDLANRTERIIRRIAIGVMKTDL